MSEKERETAPRIKGVATPPGRELSDTELSGVTGGTKDIPGPPGPPDPQKPWPGRKP